MGTMNMEITKFRLKGKTPLLGSICMDEKTYEEYLATKAKTDAERARAADDIKNVKSAEEDENPKATAFYKDEETNNIILKGYQIKGFLKEAAKALKDQIGLASYVSKIDNLVFIDEVNIPLMRNGEWVEHPDGMLERPLRASTAQGPRVALATSEVVYAPWYLDITVKVLQNSKTAKSAALTMDVVKQLLDYGALKGLLQWRNGGYGSFDTEVLEVIQE